MVSRTSQKYIDSLVDAMKKKPADIAFFKRRLEKHIESLEAAINSHQVRQHRSQQAAMRTKRALRSQIEERDIHIAVIGRKLHS